MTKKNTTKGIKLAPRLLVHEILKLFKRDPKKRFNAKQIINKLKIENNRSSVEAALETLAEKEKIILLPDKDKFRFNKNASDDSGSSEKTAIGIVDMTKAGTAFIVCEDMPDGDIFIPTKDLNNALDGDKVKVAYAKKEGKRRAEGRILEILERAREHFIGTLKMSETYGFVTTDNQNMFTDIFVSIDDIGEAKDGDKVVVQVQHWPSRVRKSPVGIITETLGKPGSSDIEMKSILIQNGFELSFPADVIAESEALSEVMDEAEIANRRDLREVTTLTIDPLTAKDFDDALSIQYLEEGNCEIGIHIADVTHYVKENSPLDKEALKRSTSVYLVDRVLPMLPEKLSNGLCSLRPNEDKFTFSAIFTFDKRGKVINEWFGKTIIHSNRRFTYEEAQERIETGEGDYAEEILALNKLAFKLRKERYKEGSISFESPEIRFKLDETGKPLEVYVKERKEAHMLVEDFMLLANRRVARFIGIPRENVAKIPFVYRVHDLPDMGKVQDFANFAKALGYPMRVTTPEEIAKAFNGLYKAAEEKPELAVLGPLAIRTMAKAVYTTDNIGHYGLGFEYYTHFTSPIRRYSDVLVHRLLEKNLDLNQPFRMKKETLEEQCKHISIQERKAAEAERQSVKYKQVEYMEQHVGQVFEGVINGFIERGIFVELKTTMCEGMVSFDTMLDRFTLDESRLSIKGHHTGYVYKMGDTIKVKVAGTNLQKRQIDLVLEE
jgi:ribonuclease R